MPFLPSFFSQAWEDLSEYNGNIAGRLFRKKSIIFSFQEDKVEV